MERQTVTKVSKPATRNSVQRRSAAPSSSGHRFTELQRSIGNQATQRLIESSFIQARLNAGSPVDQTEQEVDHMAATISAGHARSGVIVSNRTSLPNVHRKCAECESKIQRSGSAGGGCSACSSKQEVAAEVGPPSIEVVRPAASSTLVAALSTVGEEPATDNEDVLTAQTPGGPILPLPPGSPATTCNYVITYANQTTASCGAGQCGAVIVFDITGVTATGAGCPTTLNGLMLTEVVTNDHGCSPANVQGGAGCPIEENPPMAPGHGRIRNCTDTYGVCLGSTSQARIPAAGCTETVTQQLFVGGVLAETHLIRFPIRKTAGGCTGTVNRT